jgi:predicted dehydrogenase
MRKIRIFQKDTYVSVDYANHDITIVRKDGEGTKLPIPGMSLKRTSFEEADSLESELEAFVGSVRNRGVPLVSGRDGRNALGVALGIMGQIEETNKKFLSDKDTLWAVADKR